MQVITELKAQLGGQMPKGVLLECHPLRWGPVTLEWAQEKSTWSLETQRHREQRDVCVGLALSPPPLTFGNF